MRLYEFEDKNTLSLDSKSDIVDTAMDIINNHCKEFLSIRTSSNRLLYRGIKNEHQIKSTIFISVPRLFQQPIYMTSGGTDNISKKYASICDQSLKLEGFTALRNNSLFCNSSLDNAAA